MAASGESGAREVRVEVWLPPDELEGVRSYARLAGLVVPGPPGRGRGRRGNVSGLVRHFLDQLETRAGARLLQRLRRSGWDAGSLADVGARPVRVPIRMSREERERCIRHAAEVGMVRGERGDTSAFLRALLRLGCGL